MESARPSGSRPRRGPYARAAFAAIYVTAQVGLIVTAGARPEHAFGFRMFDESSSVKLSLLREIDAPSGHGTRIVPTAGGAWVAGGPDGARRTFDWHDRVRTPALSRLDSVFDAPYGAHAELARAQAALDDVAVHVDDDGETRRLLLDVVVRRNGRDPTLVRLASAERALPSP